MFVRLLLIGCLVVSAFGATSIGSQVHAAPLPIAWCGPGESAVDLPDVVAGAQIHVIYAYAADVPNGSDPWLTRIARDLAGVDSWWQAQDPTRTPRFDIADFPGCPSQFGQLDISTVALRNPTSGYNTTDRGALNAQIRTEIWGSVPMPATFAKMYLIYLDTPTTLENTCGTALSGNLRPGSGSVRAAFVYLQPNIPGCTTQGGFGTGNGWPARTAAHEILHLLAGQIRTAPHVCPDDTAHICGPEEDILKSSGGRGPLSAAVLDPGRDDYYGHGLPGQWDVRSSAWLSHLDTPPVPVTTTVSPAGAGQVISTVPGINCPLTCTAEFDLEAEVELTATAQPGYELTAWVGDCDLVVYARCTVTPGAATTLTAQFVAVSPVRVRITGDGAVSNDDDDEVCSSQCFSEVPRGSKIKFAAEPARGSTFAGWKGACRGTQKRCIVKVKQQPITLKAGFRTKPTKSRD